MSKHPIVGTWLIESFAFTDAEGDVDRPLGDRPSGGVIFTEDGHMSLTFSAAGRAPHTVDDLLGGTPAEKIAAADGYVAFGGPYRIEGDAVVVEVAYSLHPNWVGRTQRRLFEMAGDRLVLRTAGAILLRGVRRSGEARLRRA